MTDADDDLGIDGFDIDDPGYTEPDIEGAEVDQFLPDSVQVVQAKETVRARTLARYAGQLNAIDLAKAVRDEISPLTAAAERGKLIEAAITKLTLDILAENVKPKSVREAAQAIEVLHRLAGGAVKTERLGPGQRTEVFQAVIATLERTTGGGDKIPPITREAIEAVARDEQH